MAERTRFYLNAEILQHELSSAAVHVYVILSWCANREGKSYPSVSEIARKCHISENTVRKGLKELQEHRLITAETQYKLTPSGKRRQTSNIYTLQKTEAPASQISEGRGSDVEGEINNNIISINKKLSVSPSLEELTDRLELHSFEDEDFSKAVELALQDMFHAKSITVNGEIISQERVRERLSHLDVNCLDYVYSRLRDYGDGDFRNGGKYLISCLYNAPADRSFRLAAFGANL